MTIRKRQSRVSEKNHFVPFVPDEGSMYWRIRNFVIEGNSIPKNFHISKSYVGKSRDNGVSNGKP